MIKYMWLALVPLVATPLRAALIVCIYSRGTYRHNLLESSPSYVKYS